MLRKIVRQIMPLVKYMFDRKLHYRQLARLWEDSKPASRKETMVLVWRAQRAKILSLAAVAAMAPIAA
jgi:hypothetical protein